MSISEEKLELIENLMKVSDRRTLSRVRKVLMPENEEIDEEWILDALDRSSEDIKAGRVYSQQQVEDYFKTRSNKA